MTDASPIKSPQLLSNSQLQSVVEFKLLDDLDLHSVRIKKANLSSQFATAVSLDQSLLESSNFTQVKLTRFIISDCQITSCDLSNAQLPESSWQQVNIKESKLMGMQTNQSRLRDVSFEKCQGSLSQWQNTTCKNVSYYDCDLHHAYFNQADLRGVVFSQCNLNETDFSQANLSGADIRGSQIENIRIDFKLIKGMIVDPAQALYLARMMGLQIEF